MKRAMILLPFLDTENIKNVYKRGKCLWKNKGNTIESLS